MGFIQDYSKKTAIIMVKTQDSPHSALLCYLGGDEQKLHYYMEVLSRCVTAYDVAQKVVHPIFVEANDNDLTPDTVCKVKFYGPIAALASEVRGGRPLKPNTLYYHISNHVRVWDRERRERQAADREGYVNVEIRHLPDGGGTEVRLRIPAEHVSDRMGEALRELIALGTASLLEKKKRRFDGRGESRVVEIVGSPWLMPDVLALLEAYAPEAILGYQSANIRRDKVFVGEAVSMLDAELEEYGQCGFD